MILVCEMKRLKRNDNDDGEGGAAIVQLSDEAEEVFLHFWCSSALYAAAGDASLSA